MRLPHERRLQALALLGALPALLLAPAAILFRDRTPAWPWLLGVLMAALLALALRRDQQRRCASL